MYRPCQFGLRFSRNARTPSWKSWPDKLKDFAPDKRVRKMLFKTAA